jgi:hypothetical protein
MSGLMDPVLWLLFLGLVVWCWQSNLRYREYSIIQCRKICNEMNMQLLDQTVSLSSIRIRKDKDGKFKPLLEYNFEVSIDGVSRCNGYVILLGLRVIYTEINLPDGPVILQNNDQNTRGL